MMLVKVYGDLSQEDLYDVLHTVLTKFRRRFKYNPYTGEVELGESLVRKVDVHVPEHIIAWAKKIGAEDSDSAAPLSQGEETVNEQQPI